MLTLNKLKSKIVENHFSYDMRVQIYARSNIWQFFFKEKGYFVGLRNK